MCPIAFSNPALEYFEIRDDIDAALREVNDSGRWTAGAQVGQFESEFSIWCGARHCVAVGNGMDALTISMRALGISPGDEIVTVANAGGYATYACRLIGAIPVWVDVCPVTLALDVEQLESALSARTKLVVVTHLYGIAVDAGAVRAKLNSAGRHEVKILEDCAQAHGATLNGQRVGTTGDMAAFSFYPTKNLGALGDAGAILTNSDSLAETALALRQYGWTSRFHADVPGGSNSRMDEIQAAVLRKKLPRLEERNARRREIFGMYAANIKGGCKMLGPQNQSNVVHLAIMRTPDRDRLRDLLFQHGIATDIHYPVLDCDQISEKNKNSTSVNLPVSRKAQKEIVSLPCYPGLLNSEIELVVETINRAM